MPNEAEVFGLPKVVIDFKTKGSLDSYVGYNTAYLVLEGTDEAVNVDPVFTVQVIDIRELRHLVDMADDAGVNVDDIINGRDLSGRTRSRGNRNKFT